MQAIVSRLLASDEPSVRWKVRANVLGEDVQSRPMRQLRDQIRTSARVGKILGGLAALKPPPYAKWRGAHWVLIALADLGYPPHDESLHALRDGVQRSWLESRYFEEYHPRSPKESRPAVPLVDGRYRRCGSQQGGALWSISRLGVADERTGELSERLRHWQWPDGGWNCDRDQAAASSSVYETLLPMRGLHAYGQQSQDARSLASARKAADVFLSRRLLFRRSDGRVIRGEWMKLHYPVYWHYDVLAALKGLAEVGLIQDERCAEALDLLQAKRLRTGGWPAEAKYYRVSSDALGANVDYVDWGGVGQGRMNEWVSADALAVLAAAGRE
jgi:hypothetical protein